MTSSRPSDRKPSSSSSSYFPATCPLDAVTVGRRWRGIWRASDARAVRNARGGASGDNRCWTQDRSGRSITGDQALQNAARLSQRTRCGTRRTTRASCRSVASRSSAFPSTDGLTEADLAGLPLPGKQLTTTRCNSLRRCSRTLERRKGNRRMTDYGRRKLNHALAGSASLPRAAAGASIAAPFSSKVSVASHPNAIFSAVYFLGVAEGIWARNDWNITDPVPAGAGGAAVRTAATGEFRSARCRATAAFGAWLVGVDPGASSRCRSSNRPFRLCRQAGDQCRDPKTWPGRRSASRSSRRNAHCGHALSWIDWGLIGKAELVATAASEDLRCWSAERSTSRRIRSAHENQRQVPDRLSSPRFHSQVRVLAIIASESSPCKRNLSVSYRS